MRGCNKKKKAKYIVIVFFAIIILGRIFIPWALEPENFRDTKNKINSFINRYTIPDSYNAKSLIAVDLSNNNDFVSKRANEQQTPASLAKLFVIDYATISSGWLDLKVKNETNNIYQIDISFDENYMYGKILSDKESTIDYKIVNGNLNYIKENNKIYECVEVIRIEIDKKTKKEIKKEKLYDEKVLIKYELPSDVKVEEM